MSVKRGEIKFELKLPERLRGAGLPIEVRASNRKLIGRFDANQRVAVDAGAYFVSLRLPSGEEVTDWVEVAANATATARLTADSLSDEDDDDGDGTTSGDAPEVPGMRVDGFRTARPPRDDFFGGTLGGRRGVPIAPTLDPHEERHAKAVTAPDAEPDVALTLHAWTGTIGTFTPVAPSKLEVQRRRGELRVTISASADPQTVVQLLTPHRPGAMLVVPTPPGAPTATVIVKHGRGAPTLDAHLDNPLADAMIRDTTEVQRTQRLADTMSARGLLADKISDPIAAVAVAVALLAVDQAERVHDWLSNLAHMFTWLPDGAALAAESAARRGDHGEAVHHLLSLQARGIPLFSDSLSYALDRLGRYERDRGEPRADRATLQALRRRLQPYAEFRIYGRPLTTFRGSHPDQPGDAKSS